SPRTRAQMRPPLTPEERQALTDPGTLAKATAAAPFATACQSQVEMSAPLPSRNVLFSVRRVVFVRRSERTQRRRLQRVGRCRGFLLSRARSLAVTRS